MRKKVTMEMVAKAAGVSRATVSLVARNSPLVSDATRELITKTMKDMDYVADRAAARLRSNSSGTVGLIVPNLINPFFIDFLAGAERTMADEGRVILLANSYDDTERQEDILQRFREHSVDGIILCPAVGTPPELLSRIANWGIPVIQAMRAVSPTESDYAGTDNASGMLSAVRHLTALGHQRIVFVSVSSRSSARAERVGAFHQGLAEADGVEGTIIETEFSLDGAIEAGARIKDEAADATGIICFNDIVAAGVMQGLRQSGAVPGETHAIIGFGDLPVARMAYPQLTTVATNPGNTGSSASTLLARRLGKPDAPFERVLTVPSLVVRGSTFAL